MVVDWFIHYINILGNEFVITKEVNKQLIVEFVLVYFVIVEDILNILLRHDILRNCKFFKNLKELLMANESLLQTVSCKYVSFQWR